MAAPSFVSGYISTGVPNVSRFTISGDPRRMFSIPLTGGMVDWGGAPNADLSPISYNGNYAINASPAIQVGGVKNLYSSGQAVFSMGNATRSATSRDILLGSGATLEDAIALGSGPSFGAVMHIAIQQAVDPLLTPNQNLIWIDANGEMVSKATVAATGVFGACNEQFTVAGTVTATAGSQVVTGAGTNFGGLSLPGYAYTPSRNHLQPGDIIAITQGAATAFHRIITIDSNTQLHVYPAWGGTTAGGLVYQLARTGYGSHSNVVQIKNRGQSPLIYAYYAGSNSLPNAPDGSVAVAGTIQCACPETGAHFTAPQTSAAIDVKAIDIALYKSYLLYGYDGSISWSVAGFPTSFTTGFGATDFPAGNTNVVDIDDDFIAFEYLGDQLVALFRHAIWLVQPTGSVPEFNFYKLPIPNGALMRRNTQRVGQTYQRPSCSAPNSVFYTSDYGLHVMTGAASKVISGPVNRIGYSFLGVGGGDISAAVACAYEPMTNSVIWHGYNTQALIFSLDDQAWRRISINTIVPGGIGLSAIPVTNFGLMNTSLVVYTRTPGTGDVWQIDSGARGPAGGAVAGTGYDWSWNSPVVSLGDDPDGFMFGGCQVEGDNIVNNVTLQIYAGRTPYTLEAWGGAITVDASNNRQILGKKTDAPFVAFKISGTKWFGGTAIHVYDGRVAKGR